MPLYEYECQQCHRRTEKRQKFSDPEITECPHCGGPLERVLSAPAFSFAGGGWYKDLYSSAKPGAGKSESSGSSSEAKASSTEGSGSSAPAAPASSPAPSAPAASAPSSSSSSSDKK